jgi:hypothetical protein
MICRTCLITCHRYHETSFEFPYNLEQQLQCDCGRYQHDKIYPKCPILKPEENSSLPTLGVSPVLPSIHVERLEIPQFMKQIDRKSMKPNTKYHHEKAVIEIKKEEVETGELVNLNCDLFVMDDSKNLHVSQSGAQVYGEISTSVYQPTHKKIEIEVVEVNDHKLWDMDIRIDKHVDVTLWPNRFIPYVIDEQSFIEHGHDYVIARIEVAISEWNQMCPIKFEVKKPNFNNDNYLVFIYNETSTHTYVGMMKFPGQQVSIHPKQSAKGNLWHEMAHCAGLYHEHQRLDRDKYLNIRNISEEAVNFQPILGYHCMNPYNVYSIMHYELGVYQPNLFVDLSQSQQLTAVKRDEIGQRDRIDDVTVKRLNQMYCMALPCSSEEPDSSIKWLAGSLPKRTPDATPLLQIPPQQKKSHCVKTTLQPEIPPPTPTKSRIEIERSEPETPSNTDRPPLPDPPSRKSYNIFTAISLFLVFAGFTIPIFFYKDWLFFWTILTAFLIFGICETLLLLNRTCRYGLLISMPVAASMVVLVIQTGNFFTSETWIICAKAWTFCAMLVLLCIYWKFREPIYLVMQLLGKLITLKCSQLRQNRGHNYDVIELRGSIRTQYE